MCVCLWSRFNALVREEESDGAFWESMKNTNVKGERVPEHDEGDDSAAVAHRGQAVNASETGAVGRKDHTNPISNAQIKGLGGRRDGPAAVATATQQKPLSKDAPVFAPSKAAAAPQQTSSLGRGDKQPGGAVEEKSSADSSRKKHNSRKFDKHHHKDRSTRKFGGPPPPI